MRSLAIFGSTGSIGTQALDVVSAFSDRFSVEVLTAGRNLSLLQTQIDTFRPRYVGVLTEECRQTIAAYCQSIGHEATVVAGGDAFLDLASLSHVDVVVMAIVGSAALPPTLAAIKAQIPVALASKEVLVAAGQPVMSLAAEKGVPILPIDSEHAALKQCLAGISEDPSQVQRLVLTASGGPFWQRDLATFSDITKADALRHPNWSMGAKITIDSATMMNKGLEVIEAHYLYGIDLDQIDVVIHPTSIVHSFVEFWDGTFLAQMSLPDMRLPIQYAITYPEKWKTPFPRLSLTQMGDLAFHAPDLKKFPMLQLAYDCARQGGTAPVVMNAANEVVVSQFLDGQCSFVEISDRVRSKVEAFDHYADPSIDDIIEIDAAIKGGVTVFHG